MIIYDYLCTMDNDHDLRSRHEVDDLKKQLRIKDKR